LQIGATTWTNFVFILKTIKLECSINLSVKEVPLPCG
jgi:hypothetical protein